MTRTPDHPSPPTGTASRDGAFTRIALTVAGVCVVSGAACFAVDLPVARWAMTSPLPRELKRLLDLCELFAHSTGVVALLIALAVIDPKRAWAWRVAGTTGAGIGRVPFLRMIAATFAGGLATDVLKVLVTRVRPRAADLSAVAHASDTFDRAVVAIAKPGHSDLMSFPSGHAAVAAGLATMLAWRYPQHWPVFATFAALAAAQRVFARAHYPSDVLFGAALGIAGAALLLGTTMPGRTLDAPESAAAS
jgi:acid phosphatase family membrane protein YuiD